MKKRQMEDTKLATVLKDQELAEIVRRLIAAYRPERIYLFGSKARGDSGGDSDYDLMVVTSDSAPPACVAVSLMRCFAAPVPQQMCSYGAGKDSSLASISVHRCHTPLCRKEHCSMKHDPVRTEDTRAWLSSEKVKPIPLKGAVASW